MACFSPLRAWQADSGEILFAERGSIRRELQLPCGQCVGCRLERSRQWAMRCVHESKLHRENSFVTLTYDEEHVPADGSLNYRDFQLFMKRLRKEVKSARFYMCGEYGEERWRPHFHACLFGVGFADRTYFKSLSSGFDVFVSPMLNRLWPWGFSSIGDVTFESAAYVARYVLKKVNGDLARDHYSRVVPGTGEVVQLEPEFTHMSLKPGIGAGWYEKYHKEVFPFDRVVVNGVRVKPPKYYERLAKEDHPERVDFLEYDRYVKAEAYASDNTPERLAAREAVTKARLSKLYRSFE